ncbi:hypothetical protein FACS1894170_12140 [Planctomycetales bacterium]|nr:hypothetical protein FACS1894170_12140 [Planctomycetales bacterium]
MATSKDGKATQDVIYPEDTVLMPASESRQREIVKADPLVEALDRHADKIVNGIAVLTARQSEPPSPKETKKQKIMRLAQAGWTDKEITMELYPHLKKATDNEIISSEIERVKKMRQRSK